MQLHLVSFDVPLPANYGGVIDVFHKIKALHEAGIKIKLHCFSYGRDKDVVLEKYCNKVYYYPRFTSIFSHFSVFPYIIKSRRNKELFYNLMRDNHPILFEGHHTCGFLDHTKLANRLKVVRIHNVEQEYYKQLALSEKAILKKIYYHLESWKLKRFEKTLQHANRLLTISPKDTLYFESLFNQVLYVPAFHKYNQVQTSAGFGMYALYHGNLSVNENDLAANFVIDEVFSKVQFSCIIAGSGASEALKNKLTNYPNIVLLENLSEDKMDELISNAHVHILPTFQATGIKLKLIHCLFAGRFCLVNPMMVEQTGLEDYCDIANTGKEFLELIEKRMLDEFTEEMVLERKKLDQGIFSNEINATKIIEVLKELTKKS